jgi:hypothetical protein
MPANAVITLPDSQGTPVDHDFTPVRIKGDVASYINYVEAHAIGRETMNLSLSENTKLRKMVVVLKVPRLITETINSVEVPSVPDYGMLKVEVIVPMTWTQADAEDLVELGSEALDDAVIVGMACTGAFVY